MIFYCDMCVPLRAFNNTPPERISYKQWTINVLIILIGFLELFLYTHSSYKEIKFNQQK